MIYLIIFLLGILLAGNHAVSKNFLYPPALFTGVWFLSIIALALSGDTFYPISLETLLVYFMGALCFSMGGLAVISITSVTLIKRCNFTSTQKTKIQRLLDIFLVILVIGLPIYLQENDVDFSDPLGLAMRRSEINLDQETNTTRSFGLIKNLVVLSQIIAMAMHQQNDGTFSRRWRSYLMIVIAIIYGASSGTKGNAVMLILTLLFISFIQEKRINFIELGLGLILALGIFAIGLLFVNFAYLDKMETIPILMEVIQNYWLGGLVTFERIVQAPASFENTQNITRFFLETGNGFGANFKIPSIHMAFTNISASQDSNTYTLYISYFKDYGWLGLMLGLFLLGCVLTWIYKAAYYGNPIAIALYGANSYGIILSIQAEHFFLGLNFYLKLLLMFYLLYYLSIKFSIPANFKLSRKNA